MKRFLQTILILATSALLLLAGCAKEEQGLSALLEGDATTVTFTASMDDGTATKAAADGDGAAANVNRCIMEIYYDGSLFERKYAEVTGTTTKIATFTTQVVANRTYTVAFWADCVESTSTLETDLYYTTNTDQPNGGLQAIALKGIYVGNSDARDAFYSVDNYTIAQGGSACVATLKRPFAQVNVITTDWDKADKVSNLKPTGVDVTIKNPLTAFNALTGVASTTVSTLTYNAGIYTSPTSGTDATLSMDYLFASADRAVIDIDWKAGQGTDASTVSHSFSNIPYQRNYRTNIKGNLLTSTGQWTVTVDPIWEEDENGEFDVAYTTVCDIAGANDFVANNTDKKEINVTFSSQPTDAGVPTETGKNAIVTSLLAENATYNIDVASSNEVLYVGDYDYTTSGSTTTYDYNTILPGMSQKTNSASVNLVVTDTQYIGTLVVNSPSKSVSINGQTLASGKTYHIENLTVEEVSMNTVIIESGMTVTNLVMKKGGLEIHGSVTNVTIPNDHSTILVRACEGLSSTVYGILEPYIDIDNGYVGEQESGKETYRVYQKAKTECIAQIDTTKYYTLKAAFTAVKDGETITLIKDCETGASYSETNMLALTTANVTLDLNGKTITETNNFSFVIAGNNDIVKDGTIVSGYNSEKTCEYHSYAMVVGGKTTADKVTGVQINNVTFTGGVSIGGSTEGNEADYQGPAEVTIDGCTITSGDFYAICAQPANTNSEVTVLSGTYNHQSSQYSALFDAAAGCTISLKGGTYDADPSDYVAEDYKATKTGENEWTVSAMEPVAKIKETDQTYTTLAKAINAATSGQTIELLKNVSLGSQLTIGKNLTFELNDSTISCGAASVRAIVLSENAEVTFKNGGLAVTNEGSLGLLDVTNGKSLTMNKVNMSGNTTDPDGSTKSCFIFNNATGKTFTLTDCTGTTNYRIFRNNKAECTLTVTNGTYNCGGYNVAFQDSGSATYDNVTITVNGQGTSDYQSGVYVSGGSAIVRNCTIACPNSKKGAITVCNEGSLTVYGGTYSGDVAADVLSSGGTITFNSQDSAIPTVTGTNYALYSDSNNAGESTQHNAHIIVNDGTITGNIGFQHAAKAWIHGGTINGNVTLIGNAEPIYADGGTFSFNPETATLESKQIVEIADGYKAVDNGNNTWSIVVDPNVTNVNTGAGYSTLKEAVENASSGDVIRLDKDFTETNEVDVYDKDITLDLNSKEMTYTNIFRVEHKSGNEEKHSSLTIDDLSNEKTGKIITSYSSGNAGLVYLGDCDKGTGVSFTMNAGTIEHSATGSSTIYGYYDCDEITINGGKILRTKANSSGKSAIYMCNGNITVNAGELITTGTNYCEVIYISKGILTINGGTISSTSTGSYSYCINGGYSSGTINISGGTISAFSESSNAYTIYSNSSNIINITGGELSADVKSTSTRYTIRNIYNAYSSSSITGGTFKVGRTGSSYSGYKYDDSIKSYIPSTTHKLNGPSTSEGSTLGVYTVTAK